MPPFPACPKVAEKQTHRALSQEVNRMYQEIGSSQFQRENTVLIEISTSRDTEPDFVFPDAKRPRSAP